MDEHYKHSIVEYSDIVQDHNKECKRGRKKENKSLWNPPGRKLGSNERPLLSVPPSSTTFFNKLSLRDPVSNRVICYNIRPIGKINKSDSSFVYLKDDSGYLHSQIGSIVSLFAHTFTETYYWAEVDLYSQACRDSDCGILFTSSCTMRDIFLLDNLSYPLTVALDNDNYWFLDDLA